MATNQPISQPSAQTVLASLAAAADAARQAYFTAMAANPGADLSQLYSAEMQAAALWSQAQNKVLTNNSGVAASQAKLDASTQSIRNQLATLTDISTAISLVGNLVQLATTVAKCFA
jgi:hypothetical protein